MTTLDACQVADTGAHLFLSARLLARVHATHHKTLTQCQSHIYMICIEVRPRSGAH